MLRVATSLALSTAVSAQAGYTTDTDVTIYQALGTKLLEVETAIESSPPDWSAAIAAYQDDVDGGDGEVSLANIGKTHGDGPSNSEYRKFTAFHGDNADYANDFVHQALSDTFHPRLPLSSSDGGVAMMDLPDVDAGTADRSGSAIAIKSRQEMAMKGIALQSLMMGMINHLYKAYDACSGGQTSPEQYVDQAWVLWHGGEKGPIALGDKRCIQFGTCTSSDADTFPGGDGGDSAVNTEILAAFVAIQTAAKGGDCATMLTRIENTVVPQAFVPVLQGLFREAWEVDEKMLGTHFGADGFVEQIEGWAFMMAVLPRIDSCSPDVATTVRENVQIRTSGTDPRMVNDGFQSVIAAVEGTFACLKITCGDINTMYGSADRVATGSPAATACPHWNACQDGATLPRAACEVLPTCDGGEGCPPEKTSGASISVAMRMAVAATLAAAVIVGYTRLGVLPSATEAEIAKAYRKGALRNHPDKSKEPGAQERFVAIAEAYETLSDPVLRKQYDAGGSTAAQPGQETFRHRTRTFDFNAADELFRSSFGDVVWKQWRPGKTVSGMIRRDGKVFSITIDADGTSDEEEQDSDEGSGRFAFIKSTGGGDGVSYQLSIDGGSLGEALSQLVVPHWLRMLPAVGVIFVTVVSWLPTVCLGYCVLKCCFK